MNMKEAVVSVFTNWKNFKGRACRSEFWYFILAWYLLSFFIKFVEVNMGLVGTDNSFDAWMDSDGGLLSLLFYLFTLIPLLSVTSRRLQDRGISGWWQLSYVTIIGALIIPLLCIAKAKENLNEWGRNPLLDK